jgi:Icc-related predicted phosphoesterase
MRLAYTADLHGDIASYRALLDLAVSYGARAAIVGGDLFPHAIRLDRAIESQRAFVREQLRPLLVEFRSAHPTLGVYLLPGNDDWAAAAAALSSLEQDGLVHPLHERTYDLGLLTLAGYACVPLTPFSIKDFERRDDGPLPPYSFGMAYTSWGGAAVPATAHAIAALPSIAEALAALAGRSDPARTVYICHTPPFDTALDQMARGRHPGSKALRTFIEQRKPLLTLHGHIHEAPQISGRFAIRLGSTWCVNPGHDQRRFQAVTLDTDDIAGTIEHTVYGKLRPE